MYDTSSIVSPLLPVANIRRLDITFTSVSFPGRLYITIRVRKNDGLDLS